MSHLDTVRAAIVARLQSVANIGAVHDYQRYAADLARMKALYVSEIGGKSQVRGWYVSRVSRVETAPFIGRRAVTCGWVIRGYMALADADESEITFDNLVESICDTFRADETLGGTVATTSFAGRDNDGPEQVGPQAPEIGPVMFAGVLCHAARLELITRWFLQDAP
ncbi:hypothetical protein [Thauera sinica]|uniref:Uncharacterized protein n=1 Tax=Thauera sinica TaxID=2665146 RepID=A0ABW1ARL2_9RHOO|nr:hypothetical protein [Thauera sp. K11]ATE60167.1 hypothetical protein CCZ27_09590 [Thauera sp. K11]